MKIRFLPENIVCEAAEKKSLLEIAAKNGVNIDGSCAGAGVCGKCRVRILEGNAGTPDERELEQLSEADRKAGWRLSCRLIPDSDLTVFVPRASGMADKKAALSVLPEDFRVNSGFEEIRLQIPAPELIMQKSDCRRIEEALDREALVWNKACIQRIPSVLAESGDVSLVLCGKEILDIRTAEETGVYGMAFDIGTTTVVGMLWDLLTGELLASAAETNPQSAYGGDVISRIQFTTEKKGNLELLNKLILDCLNGLTGRCLRAAAVKKDAVYAVTVVGNTTMSHLVTCTDPKSLALAPYVPVFNCWPETDAESMWINAFSGAKVRLLPNIAGHVGSDITAGIIAEQLDRAVGLTVFVDIGTNGEIVVARNGEMRTCSTAAGPAFEGASIFQGMRASSGAVDSVRIENGSVSVTTVDDCPGLGICGSGLIDAVAQMLEAEIIEESGKLLDRAGAEKKGLSADIQDRLETDGKQKQFVLLRNEDGSKVVLTQKDIREVQLAKAAIAAGIEMLLEEIGESPEGIDRMIIAGAFGTFINKESALKIGLFPKKTEGRLWSAGNTAGIGACMALLSEDKRAQAYKAAAEISHVELGGKPAFQEKYIALTKFSYFLNREN